MSSGSERVSSGGERGHVYDVGTGLIRTVVPSSVEEA